MSVLCSDLQANRVASHRPPEQKRAQNGQSKMKGVGSSSGPPERSSSTDVQGTQILASTGQASGASNPIGQTSRSNNPVGQASRAGTPVDQTSRPSTLKTPDNKDGNSMVQESRTNNNNNSRVIPVQATGTLLYSDQNSYTASMETVIIHFL